MSNSRTSLASIVHSFNLGVTLSILISLFINFVLKTSYYSMPTPELVAKIGSSNLATLINVICFGLLGIFCNLSGAVFEIENWSLVKATIVHFLILQVMLLFLGFIFGWLSHYLTMVLPISLVVYIIIFFVTYNYYKNKVSEIKKKM